MQGMHSAVDYSRLDDTDQPLMRHAASCSSEHAPGELPQTERTSLRLENVAWMKMQVNRSRARQTVTRSMRSMTSLHEEIDGPFGARQAQRTIGEVEEQLQKSLETGEFNRSIFERATVEAYYGVHELRGSILFRASEWAALDEDQLPQLDKLLQIAPRSDEGCLGVYYHHGENEIHVMHLAASLGSVPVMKRLRDKYGDEVVNRASTYDKYVKSVRQPPSAARAHSLLPPRDLASASSTTFSSASSFPVGASREDVAGHGGGRVPHYPPLLAALYMSRTEAVIWLLSNNANPNVANYDGQTALHLLARSGLPSESVNKQDEALESIAAKIVECSADMGILTSNLEHIKGSNHDWLRRKTALELAASKMSSYPKHMLHLLAKSYQTPELSEPLKEVSFIAGTNPAAAEHLMEKVKLTYPARKQLFLEVYSTPDSGDHTEHMDNFVKILRMAPVAAADILDILFRKPQVRSPQKNPLPLYAWLNNSQMQCAYQPDVDSSEPPMPSWDYNATQPRAWHSTFRTDLPLNPLAQDKVYEVEVRAVHLPDLLNIRVPDVLYRLWNYPRYTEIFGRIPVQAIVVCLWQQVRRAQRLDLAVEFAALLVLLVFGICPPPEPWELTWSLLSSVILAKVLVEITNTVFALHKSRTMYCDTRTSRWTYLWDYASVEVFCGVFLAVQACRGVVMHFTTTTWRVLTAANIFLRCIKILLLFRSQQHVGETILAVQQSFAPTQNMLLLMLAVFVSFYCVFLTLKDSNKSNEYVFLYLWLALLFGEGDGIENISGFDTDHETYTGDGSDLVVKASIFFMMLASFFFAVVLLNLMIAMYSNFYEEMVPWARLLFHKMRAKACTIYLLRPTLPKILVRRYGASWCRAVLFLLAGTLVLVWFALPWVLKSRSCTSLVMAAILAAVMQLLQAAMLLAEWHALDQRHYLWVCYRSDYEEVFGQSGDKWQRNVRREMAEIQASLDRLSAQVAGLSGAGVDDAADSQPSLRRGRLRRLNTHA